MKTVHVHKYSSILSAYGMALADVVHDTQRHCGLKFGVENWSKIDDMMESLKKECREKLGEQGFDKPLLNPFLHLRYVVQRRVLSQISCSYYCFIRRIQAEESCRLSETIFSRKNT